MRTWHFLVSGKVQGVGFRAYVQRSAVELGLLGWVGNLANGQVEIMAQGKEEVLKVFKAKVLEGPSYANVDSMEINDEAPALTVLSDGDRFFIQN